MFHVTGTNVVMFMRDQVGNDLTQISKSMTISWYFLMEQYPKS